MIAFRYNRFFIVTVCIISELHSTCLLALQQVNYIWNYDQHLSLNFSSVYLITKLETVVFRLIELDEGIEALDAAIEYRSDTIHSKQLEVRHSQMLAQVGDNTII